MKGKGTTNFRIGQVLYTSTFATLSDHVEAGNDITVLPIYATGHTNIKSGDKLILVADNYITAEITIKTNVKADDTSISIDPITTYTRFKEGSVIVMPMASVNNKINSVVSGGAGTSGSSGTSGTSGVNGEAGAKGDKGDDGTSGTSGTSGVGQDGENGTSGTSGTSGQDGAQGAKGDKGDIGNDGTSGTSGISGSSGSSGTSGIDGSNGVDGLDGTSGTSGTSGEDGVDGVNGSSGTSGTSGSDGANGSNGVDGEDGTSGTSGTSGQDGNDGSNGANGTSGTSGTSGVKGDKGNTGNAGANGTSGTSGTSGINGSNGQNGQDGATITSYSGNPQQGGRTVGDIHINTDNWNIFEWNGSNWDLVGNIKGTNGQNGTSGTSGTSGAKGATGAKGDKGDPTPVHFQINSGYMLSFEAGEICVGNIMSGWNGGDWDAKLSGSALLSEHTNCGAPISVALTTDDTIQIVASVFQGGGSGNMVTAHLYWVFQKSEVIPKLSSPLFIKH